MGKSGNLIEDLCKIHPGIFHILHTTHSMSIVLSVSRNIYSGPTLSSHSQQRPPSLMWPQSFVTATMNPFTSLALTKGHLSNVATISCQIGWPY